MSADTTTECTLTPHPLHSRNHIFSTSTDPPPWPTLDIAQARLRMVPHALWTVSNDFSQPHLCSWLTDPSPERFISHRTERTPLWSVSLAAGRPADPTVLVRILDATVKGSADWGFAKAGASSSASRMQHLFASASACSFALQFKK
jgi:hypothetical protein